MEVTPTEINWPAVLVDTDAAVQATALGALRTVLLNGLRIALKGRGDVSEAQLEDFVQDSLLRVMSRLVEFQGRSKFTTWAQSIALNVAFTELRRKRWKDVSLDELMSDGERLAEPAAIAPDALGSNEDRIRLVAVLRQAIEKDLTPKQRAAILGELNEMPFDQIVTLLGTRRNAAYKMLHDARSALKRRLHGAGITSEDIRNAFTL